MATVFRGVTAYRYDNRYSSAALLPTTGANLLIKMSFTPVFPSISSNPILTRYLGENRSFIDPSEFWMLVDSFFGAPGERITFSQPNPILRNPVDYTYALNILSLVNTASVPSAQYDWPNPSHKIPSIDLLTFVNPVQKQLIGKDQFFGAPGQVSDVNFPNPIRFQQSGLQIVLVNLLENTLASNAPQSPFYQSDWANPLQPAYPVSLRTSTFYYMVDDSVPFSNYDLPNPTINQRSNVNTSWLINLLQNTLSIIPPMPFSLGDWPNPQIKLPTIVLRTWADPTKLNLLGKDQFFGAPGQVPQHEFPNPISAKQLVDLRVAMINLLENTLGIVFPPPFVMLDWPNPIGPTYSAQLRTFIQQITLNLLGKDVFPASRNYDQPNPRGYTYPVVCRVHIGPFDPKFILAFPCNNYDQPNPHTARQPIILKTFIDPTKVHLIGKDQFFGGPGQPPENHNWPNPLHYRQPIDLKSLLNNLMQGTLNPGRMFKVAIISGEAYIVTDITLDSFTMPDIDSDSEVN